MILCLCGFEVYLHDMKDKVKFSRVFPLLILAILLFILCIRFSYFVDDWHWGQDGQLSTFFDSFSNPENTLHYHNNGRYLGNFLGFLSANHKTLRNLIMTATLWTTLVFIAKISLGNAGLFPSRITLITYLTGVIFLFMPKEIFRESVGWCSAFMNYVVPTALFLICLWKLFNQPDPDRLDFSFLLLPLLSSFFMENLTIGNTIFIILLLITRLIQKKKPSRAEWLYCMGSILGLVLMFADDGYREIFQGTPDMTYWSAQTGSFAQSLEHGIHAFIYFIAPGTVGWTVAATTFGALSLVTAFLLARDKLNRNRQIFLYVLSGMDLLIAAYFLLRKLAPAWKAAFQYTNAIEAVFALIFLLSLPLFVILLPYQAKQKETMLFTWLFAGSITAPLLIAEPLSMRVFYPTLMILTMLYMLFSCLNLKEIESKVSPDFSRNILPYVLGIFLLAWGYLFSVYAVISHYEQERIKYVRYQESIGNYEINFPKLPYEEYVIISYPWERTWQERYKKFYDLNLDTNFTIVPFEEWKEQL